MPVVLPLTNEPRDWLLGDDNDIVITTDIQWSRGIAAVAQSCRIAMQLFAGEWFADLDAGIPWFQQILGLKPATAVAAARILLRRELLSVEGVLDVRRLDVTYDKSTRGLNVTWQVSTALGETPVDTLPIGGVQ